MEMPWGILSMTLPPTQNDACDIRFDFKRDLESRKNAFQFARSMHDELAKRLAGSSTIEFVPASDHYHLVIRQLGHAFARVAAGMVHTLSHGAMSVRGRPGAGSTRGNVGASTSTRITGRLPISGGAIKVDG
jgi:hypothetical protein